MAPGGLSAGLILHMRFICAYPQTLGVPSAEGIKFLNALQQEVIDYEDLIGSLPDGNPCPLAESLAFANHVFASLKCHEEDTQRIWVFTNDDRPCSDADSEKRVKTAVEDLAIAKRDITLFSMNKAHGPAFDSRKMWHNFLMVPGEEDDFAPRIQNAAANLEVSSCLALLLALSSFVFFLSSLLSSLVMCCVVLCLSRVVLPRVALCCVVFSCLVLSCVVMCGPVSSCLILSCRGLVLCCVVLCCLVLSCLVLPSSLVLSCLAFQSCLVLVGSGLILFCLVLSLLVLSRRYCQA